MGPKEYMPLETIKKDILSHYPYEVYEITPVKFKDTDKQRAVYLFKSNEGPKCLKKVYFDEENLLFVYSVIQWFYSCGVGVPKLLPTKTGSRYVKYNDSLFLVTDWIDGRKCDYDREDDICSAAKNLGRMHKISYNFKPIEGSFVRRNENDWYLTFNKHFLQLLKFYNTASIRKDSFSKIFLKSFDYYYERAAHSTRILNLIKNNELTLPSVKFNTVCHLDYVNKNLIITDSNDIYVIDFDKSKIDIPIHDIGTFLKRILKRKSTSWDFNILMLTIDNYEKERKLTSIEFLGLFAFLEFPQKYCKISKDYFNNRKDYTSKQLTAMLSEVCKQKKEHNEFCNKFQLYIEKRFDISLNT